MNNNITIGVPRGLLYYRYGNIWEKFFSILNINYIISNPTNKKILENGVSIMIDEACLAMKIYMGHINDIIDKCNYLLIPRVVSIKKKEKLCTNFSALYDLTKILFNKNILIFEVDVSSHIKEVDAFINLGNALGVSKVKSILAYNNAKKHDEKIKKEKLLRQNLLLASNKKKILIVGHPYNINDDIIGKNIVDILEENDVSVIYSDIYGGARVDFEASVISNKCYWTLNKELLGAITHYRNSVDGIIIISSFPCGPDSLTNEMIVRTIKDKPITVFIVDELNNDLGVRTRLESFIDVIKMGGKNEE